MKNIVISIVKLSILNILGQEHGGINENNKFELQGLFFSKNISEEITQ